MLIIHGTLLTLDPERAEQGDAVLHDGALRIDHAHITDLDSTDVLRARYPRDDVLDAEGMLVMPGLICAHTHLYRVLLRGMLASDTQPHRRWPQIEAVLNYEDTRYATLLGAIEAIRRGTTTVFDSHLSPNALRFSLDAVAEAIIQSGLRACLSYTVTDRDGVAHARRGIQENVRLAERIRNERMLAASMGIGTCAWISNETLMAAVGSAAIANIGFHINLGTYRGELRDCELKYRIGAIERLQRFGLFGPRTSLVHVLSLDDDELARLSHSRSTLIYCPRFIMHAGREIGQSRHQQERLEMLSLALGSDEYPADMLAELRAAPLLLQVDPLAAPLATQRRLARNVLESAGALATRVFRDGVGRLQKGCVADVILLDYAAADQIDSETWPHHLLSAIDAADVDTTIVGGRVLMRHRELLALDERAIVARARQHAHALLGRL
ncbi:MAG: amidohydrolase family protein [Anaerolineae bacterium]|nr:amidohydrolase family protein [Anaerolineae bacterium]